MALTNAQKAAARLYLGYANIYRYKHTRLESSLDFVSGDPDAEAQAVLLLAEIAINVAQVKAAVASIATSAGVKKADEVEFFPPNQGVILSVEGARNEGRANIGRLSTLLGVPVFADFFGKTGYPGDSFSEGGEMNGPSSMGGSFQVG